MRICVAITARPSYSRIKSALLSLNNIPAIELKIICSGSALLERYGNIVETIKSDGFDVVEELYTFIEGDNPANMANTAANTIVQTTGALRRIKPDFVVTIADRYETIGTAIASSYLGIPLIHVQGGEITGNIDEKVRHAITKLADIHLVSNERAAKRLMSMGEHPDYIYNTGCPSIDIAAEAIQDKSKELFDAIAQNGVGAQINIENEFVVVLQHPDTDTYEDAYSQMEQTLEAVILADIPSFIFWPNVDSGSDAVSKCLRTYREKGKLSQTRFLKNLPGKEFLQLLMKSKCLIGNSSVGIREASYLGIPVVNIGNRQIGRDRANNVIDVEHDAAQIYQAMLSQKETAKFPSSLLYGDGTAGKKIASVIYSLSGNYHKTDKRFYHVQ